MLYTWSFWPHLIKVERGQVFSTRSLLLGVAALLQAFVTGQEETQPGAGGGWSVLTCEEEADQHPRDLVIVQGSAVSEGKTKSVFKKTKQNFTLDSISDINCAFTYINRFSQCYL